MSPEVFNAVAKAKQDLPGITQHNPDEAGTKNSLIHPILRSLGWAVSDLNRVTPEFRVEGYMKHKVDYALIDTNGTPRAFVEAKRLQNSLSDTAQLHSYVGAYLGNKGFQAAGKLACIVFTNGREWRFYPINAQKGRQHFDGWHRTVDLETEDTEQCAKSLSLLLSESSICNGSAKQLLTAEFRQQLITQELQRMITQSDEALVKLLRKQLKAYSISKEEVAQAIQRPMPALAPVPQNLPTPPPEPDGTAPRAEDEDLRKRKPRSSLRVTVDSEEFDSIKSVGVAKMLPKVLQAIMKLKNISGAQLVQTCIDAKITGRQSRAWVVSADMLAELRSSPNQGARESARASKAIEGHADYFVLTHAPTEHTQNKLQQLGRALGLGSALKVEVIQGS